VSGSAVDGVGAEEDLDDEDDDVQDNLQGEEGDAEELEREGEALRYVALN
jgi:hypothetical protein